MKNSAVISLAWAASAIAQVTQLPNGTFQCSTPNAAFCATGTSLGSPIIIRCDANSIGQPGVCNDNLAGEPPIGVGGSLCWQSSPTAGDASCEKNCIVYASSGTSVLPSSLCVPSFTASSSSSSATTTSTTASTTSTVTTSKATSSSFVKTIITTLVTAVTTNSCPPVSLSTGTGTGTASTSTVGTNGTVSVSGSGSATKKPVGPSSSTTGVVTVPTAGAATTGVSAMAIFGIIVAYML